MFLRAFDIGSQHLLHGFLHRDVEKGAAGPGNIGHIPPNLVTHGEVHGEQILLAAETGVFAGDKTYEMDASVKTDTHHAVELLLLVTGKKIHQILGAAVKGLDQGNSFDKHSPKQTSWFEGMKNFFGDMKL